MKKLSLLWISIMVLTAGNAFGMELDDKQEKPAEAAEKSPSIILAIPEVEERLTIIGRLLNESLDLYKSTTQKSSSLFAGKIFSNKVKKAEKLETKAKEVSTIFAELGNSNQTQWSPDLKQWYTLTQKNIAHHNGIIECHLAIKELLAKSKK
jgi:hypothetical protein